MRKADVRSRHRKISGMLRSRPARAPLPSGTPVDGPDPAAAGISFLEADQKEGGAPAPPFLPVFAFAHLPDRSHSLTLWASASPTVMNFCPTLKPATPCPSGWALRLSVKVKVYLTAPKAGTEPWNDLPSR